MNTRQVYSSAMTHRPQVPRAKRYALTPHVLMFLFAAGWSFSVDTGARLYVAEIVALSGLIFLKWNHLVRDNTVLRGILGALGVWVIAIIFSDLVNSTPIIDSFRNLATPILGGLSLVFVVAILTKAPTAILTFLMATVIFKGLFGDAAYGETLADVTANWANIQANTNIFKVRVDPYLTPALIFIGCLIGRRSILNAGIFFIFCSVAYFSLDSRSTGLVFLVSSIALMAAHIGFKPKLGQLMIGAIVATPLVYAAYVGYVEYTLNYNPFGHNGKQLMQLENPYNPFALLLQARSEWYVWPVAFAERPLFGWGSWAIDANGRFAELRLQMMQSDQSAFNLALIKETYIPVHSLIGAALVWSGLLGLLAVMFLVKHIISLMLSFFKVERKIMPAVIFFSIMLLFHVLFSPPQHVRISLPIALGLLIAAVSNRRRTSRLPRYKRTFQVKTPASSE